jgi:hypothetical protein
MISVRFVFKEGQKIKKTVPFYFESMTEDIFKLIENQKKHALSFMSDGSRVTGESADSVIFYIIENIKD